MKKSYPRAAAISAAIAAAGFYLNTARAATSTWINPNDPTGIGNDPNAATHLNGLFNDAAHWSSGVPSSTDNANFSAPGYPFIPYTVTFSQDTNVNEIVVVNDPVTFNLANFILFANQVPANFNDSSLFIGDRSSLTVSNGTLVAQSLQIGSSTSNPGTASLAIDGSAGPAYVYTGDTSTVANYQQIDIKAGGALVLANNTFVNQAPDLATGGTNTGQIVLTGPSSGLFLGDAATISGGELHVNDGFVAPTGNSVTYDSLLYDGELFVNLANLTVNLTSSFTATTITQDINASQGFLNISGATVRITPDNGTTWNPFLTAGTVQTTIQDALLTTGNMYLDGDPAPAAGSTTTIDPSLVLVHGDLIVGNFGVASLNVNSGANIISVDGALIVGSRPQGNGTLVIDGQATISTSANITNSTYGFGELIVGKQGTGNMTLSGGAHALVGGNYAAWIGQNDNGNGTGGTGILTVTGAAIDTSNTTVPSALTVTAGDLYVGADHHTTGTLNITAGGHVSDIVGHIADNTLSSGTVIVDGSFHNPISNTNTPSTWSNSDYLVVGNDGTGSLTIRNGALVTNTIGYIAAVAGSKGTVLLDNATWNNSSFFEIGDAGNATLTVQNNATLTNTSVNLSYYASGNSLVTIDHSTWTNSDFISVGGSGNATLVIQNAANVSTASSHTIGDAIGSHGSLLVDGNGTHLSSASFMTLGNGGIGNLTIQNAANVTDSGNAGFGVSGGSAGSALVTGNNSLWTIMNGMTIGYTANATGNLTVQNHAVVAVSGAPSFLASAANSTASVLVTGAGSRFTNSAQLIIGADGSATMNVSNGAVVTCAPAASLSGTAAAVGEEGIGSGILNLSDPGTQFLASGHVNVGSGNNGAGTTNGGSGTLSLLNGALLSDLNGYVGRWAGSVGNATLSGANSTWQNSGSFFIAANDLANNPNHANLSAGSGNVTLNTGASISATSALIGANGTLTLASGTFISPTTSNNGLLKGNGTITGNLTNNATLSITTPGTINLSGTYTQSANASLSGNGTLIAQALFGQLATVAGSVQVRSNGTSAATSNLTLLTLAGSSNNWSGKLDLTNNKLIVEPASSHATVLATLQNQAAYGHTHPAGILSSTLPANFAIAVLDNAVLNKPTFGGLPVDNNAILIAPELLGDANADGHVDLTDLSTVLNNFGTATPNWTSGNFDYGPTIDLTDLSAVLNNFGLTNPNPSSQDSGLKTQDSATPTPEPTSLTLLSTASLFLFRRIRHPSPRPHLWHRDR